MRENLNLLVESGPALAKSSKQSLSELNKFGLKNALFLISRRLAATVGTKARALPKTKRCHWARSATLLTNQFLSWIYHGHSTSTLIAASYGRSDYSGSCHLRVNFFSLQPTGQGPE